MNLCRDSRQVWNCKMEVSSLNGQAVENKVCTKCECKHHCLTVWSGGTIIWWQHEIWTVDMKSTVFFKNCSSDWKYEIFYSYIFVLFWKLFFLMEQRGYKLYGFGWMVLESNKFFMCTNKIYNTRGRILGSPPKDPFSFQFSLTNLRAVYFILQYELMINKWDNNNNKKKDDTISQDAHCTLNHYNKIQ